MWPDLVAFNHTLHAARCNPAIAAHACKIVGSMTSNKHCVSQVIARQSTATFQAVSIFANARECESQSVIEAPSALPKS